MSTVLNKITVIGVGLIGGSFAKGIKKLGLAKEVHGFGNNEDNLKMAVDLHVVDSYSTDIQTAMQDCDLVMLAVPLGAMQPVLESLQPYIPQSAIITDAGSAKQSVIDAVTEVFGFLPENFVPGHPIAGKEQSGVAAADDQLFVDHRVILTPTESTSSAALETVKALWQALDARVEVMSAGFHDEVFAATSHLPHLLAFALVEMLHEHPELGNVFKYTAGGFRDFSRIASSDATMWRDISIYNHQAIAKWMTEYRDYLSGMIELVEKQDADALYELFTTAKQARDQHIVNKQD
ncbi:prephenate dehydrogenase/arogenate dehydrogenase family protein [Thiomicrorhabdus sp. 6S3-12]|uniref:prephenate dehydrogenase n=1 Tax=Thiomicrorhabdus sp. 6S3-12 TaxID=2819681 RepID=UPI001AADEE9A|nr:prephenate dehydrogenase/arogenate dehydrogenase family protein [Thiomicrorhabdus sp. 6S3-12]MBO1925121.1 prephenate dehydrogenase/arogenate dehydrogenase family protein [Thiomicrorhabdus sp. 6S3-12]